MSLSPQAQRLLATLQQYQLQLEEVVQQRKLLELEVKELNRVKEEVEKLPEDAEVYQNVGHVLIKVKKDEVLKDVNDKLELLEIRLSALKKQEDMIKKEIEKLKSELQKYMGGATASGGG